MALEIKKTTKLVGYLKVDKEIIKQVTVDIDQEGVSTVYESMVSPEAYAKNRSEMRKQEKAFREERYKVEDAILAELEKHSDS